MTARRTLALFRLWALVLLAMIGLQAMEPVHSPLQREAGSAFSVSTADVALATGRRADVAKATPVFTPPLAAMPPSPVHLAPAVARFATADQLRPAVRGPPPRDRSERLPDLRGPPLA
jgi:hypothetical protein